MPISVCSRYVQIAIISVPCREKGILNKEWNSVHVNSQLKDQLLGYRKEFFSWAASLPHKKFKTYRKGEITALGNLFVLHICRFECRTSLNVGQKFCELETRDKKANTRVDVC